MSTFGGNFFGKPIPMTKAPGQGALPVVKPGAPPAPQNLLVSPGGVQSGHQAGKLGVVPPPPAGSAMGPNGPVPLGKKGDCPICRG